jgi:hypothetical protein
MLNTIQAQTMAQSNKISKNLSGPDRWARVGQIMDIEKEDTKLKSQKFGKHNFTTWTTKQIDAYATAITGIKPNKGTNRDRKAGRDKGRYIKGNI